MAAGDAARPLGEFGALLRRHRTVRLLSQEALADRSGLSVRTVRNLEHGVIAAPRGDSVRRLAGGLGLDDAQRAEFLRAAAPPKPDDGHIHVAAEPPSQLPAPPHDFVGRSRLMVDLTTILDAPRSVPSTPAVAVLTGPAGVGKTALAVRAAHHLRATFVDGQLFVPLRGASRQPAEPYDVLERLLRSLGMAAAELPQDFDDRLGLFRSLVAPKRLLIVLDDAHGEEQVRALVPGTGICALLITSRRRLTALEYGRPLDVEPFRAEESIELLGRIAGADRITAEPAAAEGISELSGHLPLALRIAGAKLASRPHVPLARLEARLADERTRLDELSFADLAVRASVALTYDGLDAPTRSAFRRLSLVDLATVPNWLAAHMVRCDAGNVERVLDPLIDCRLLEVDVAGGELRFRFHDLIRVYARERATTEDHGEIVVDVLHAALDGALSVAGYARDRLGTPCNLPPEPPELAHRPSGEIGELIDADPTAWFDLARDNMIALVSQCGDIAALDEQTHRLVGLLSGHLEIRGWYSDWRHTHEVALRCARRSGNRLAEAFFLRRIGELHLTQNDHETAATQLAASIRISARISDNVGLAYAHYGLGIVRHAQARLSEAKECYAAAQAALAETADRLAEAHAWYGLGAVHQELGARSDALECFERALAGFRKVDDRRGAAHLMRWIASLYIEFDRHGEAEQILAECLMANRTLGDRLGEAYALQTIGEHQSRRGQWDASYESLSASGALFEELDVGSGRALVLRTLGEMHTAQRAFALAGRELHTALDLFQTLDMPLGEARTLLVMGDLHLATGEPAAAREPWLRALRLFEKLGVPERNRAHDRLYPT